MGIWGKLGAWAVKLKTPLPSKVVTNGAGEVLSKTFTSAGKTVLTWGNAAKVAVVGGVGYIFLTGGLSKTVSSTLGIPEWAAQLLIWAVGLIIILYLIKQIRSYFRGRIFGGSRRNSSYRRRY